MDLFKRPGSDKWQAYCYLWDGTKRRRVLKSTGIVDDGTVKSKQTAEAIAREIERSLTSAGHAASRPGKTLKQALLSVIKSQELAQRTDHALRQTRFRGARLVEFFDINAQMRDIDTDKLRDFAVWSRKKRRASTVKAELMVLGQAFKAVGVTPPQFPELGDTSAKPQRFLEPDEQKALLLAIPPPRRLHILAYLQLGLRQSELWKITDVDWKQRFVHVEGTKTKGSVREVPIPADLYEEMLPLRKGWDGFPYWARNNQDRTLKRAGKRAGICDDLSINDLRGTYATMMARAGVPILTVAKMMGNSVKMLEKIYAQVGKRGEHMHEAAAKLPRLTATKRKGETGT